MKNRIRKTVLIAAILIVSAGVFAQSVQTQYFMKIPQASEYNPAFRPSANIFIGLPAISSIYAGFSNNLLNVSNLVQPMQGTDSIITVLHPDYDRGRFLRRIGSKGFASMETRVPLFGIGLNLNNDWWIDFGISGIGLGRAKIPSDLFTLVLEGNEDFIGSSADLSGMGLHAQAYLQTHIGLSKNITKKLRIGGRLKLIQGAMSASLIADELEIQINEDYSHTLNTNVMLKLNGPFDVTLDEDGFIDDIIFRDEVKFNEVGPSFKNFGMGIDLGAEYSLLDNLHLSASIIDLGFISWGSESYTFSATNDFTFDGFDITEVIEDDDDFDMVVEEFGDSLLNTFDFVESEDGYATGLPTKIYIGGRYEPLPFLSLGLLSRTTIGMGLRESLTLSATLLAGDVLSTTLSYTMTNKSYNNFGFGLAVRGGPVQFYTIIDQIPANWIEFTGDSGNDRFVIPQRMDYLNLRFGINMLFGRVQKKKADVPMLLE